MSRTYSQIKFKTTILKSSLCDYCVVYILVKQTIAVVGAGATEEARKAVRYNKQAIFKKCAQLTDCIAEVNNTKVDNAKYLDAAVLMYNLIEYSNKYSGTTGGLWQYHKDEPKNSITDSNSFKFKAIFLANTND